MRTVAAILSACALIAALSSCSVVKQAATWNSAGAYPTGAASGTASAAAADPATPAFDVKPLLDPAKKYLGLEIPDSPDSTAPATQFATYVGKKPNLLGAYVAWDSSFDSTAASNAWKYGGMYFMVWEPYDTTAKQIAAGDSDNYIVQFAEDVRALNIPIALSFGHEMNGNWYPWGTTQTSASDFVAAWRHIHDVFVRYGATNVIWVWDPNNIYPVPTVALQPYYPGDAYVDWAAITGYWTVLGPHTWATLFQPTLTQIRTFTQKPLLIAETSIEAGSNEVASVNALFQAVNTHADVVGFVWYDYDRQGDWRLENRPDVEAAFRTAAANPDYGFDVSVTR
jgi:glycosyl hydrolase family 26